MAFIIEQAGGRATDGNKRIPDIKLKDIHQRVSLYIGSTFMVNTVEKFLNIENEKVKLNLELQIM